MSFPITGFSAIVSDICENNGIMTLLESLFDYVSCLAVMSVYVIPISPVHIHE